MDNVLYVFEFVNHRLTTAMLVLKISPSPQVNRTVQVIVFHIGRLWSTVHVICLLNELAINVMSVPRCIGSNQTVCCLHELYAR